MFIYMLTQDSVYDPTKLALHANCNRKCTLTSNCANKFKKTVFFCDDMVHLIDEESILTYVFCYCVLLYNMRLRQKSKLSTRNEKNPISVKTS